MNKYIWYIVGGVFFTAALSGYFAGRAWKRSSSAQAQTATELDTNPAGLPDAEAESNNGDFVSLSQDINTVKSPSRTLTLTK